jgi:hypothetical protein
MRQLSPSQASGAQASFDMLRAASQPMMDGRADFELAETLVRDFSTQLAAPDALHLTSAQNAGAALATFDAGLAGAAGTQGVDVDAPG